MIKRLFMVGDSHIWGTEQTAPDGKICEYPAKLFSLKDGDKKEKSDLPSETTYPYFLDDWDETYNYSWPGHGVDFVTNQFIHRIFDKLEPNDVVSIFFPTGTRRKYQIRLAELFNNSLTYTADYLDGRSLEEFVFANENQQKVNNNWHLNFKELVEMQSDREGYSDTDKDAIERFLKLNDTQLKALFLDVDMFLNLTFNNSSSQIYQMIDAVKTIEKLANSKGNHNVFYVVDSSTFDENKNNNVVKHVKKVLGDQVSSRVLNWDWANMMEFYYFVRSKTKDIKEWMHEEGHFTAKAHEYFADQIRFKFNALRQIK